jgi:phosphatidylglycerol lysyltransferase
MSIQASASTDRSALIESAPRLRKDELETWLRSYGTNSTSYVLLEGAKRYFTSARVGGFIGYQMKAGVLVIGGDPVCAVADAPALLADFLAASDGRAVCAYQVTPEFLDAFREAGFGDVQIGNEAIFNLEQFTLAGGQMELVRAATNKARREGIRITEHHPFAYGSGVLNAELRAVSDEWLRNKNNREMGFLLGGLGLECLSAKRYFIARSEGASGRLEGASGRLEGFIICEPIYGRRGYYLDVTRRRRDAVRGTMELLTTEVFRILHAEGYAIASMGLAPLANMDDPDLKNHPRLTSLMRYAYEHIENTYDFKHLYRYKAKYHPHAWERRYLCFLGRRLSPRVLFATLQVRAAFSLREFFRQRQSGAETQTAPAGFSRKVESWKHAASFVIGLCSALLFSS